MKKNLCRSLENQALEFINNSELPTCIGDVARSLNVSWATARQVVMLLAIDKKINIVRSTTGWILMKQDKEDKP